MSNQFLYCNVLIDNHRTPLWYIADFDVQVGDFVLVPLRGESNIRIGYIMETKTCNASNAPYYPQFTKHIAEKYNEDPEYRAAKRNIEANLYKVIAEKRHQDKLKIRESIQNRIVNKNTFERKQRNLSDFSDNIETVPFTPDSSIRNQNKLLKSATCVSSAVFRGVYCEVEKAIQYLGTKCPYSIKKYLVDEGIYEFVYNGEEINNIIADFPNLKAVLFLEFFRTGAVETAYSRSGYPFITDHYFAGNCDFHAECRWSNEHLPSESKFHLSVMFINVGEYEEVDYTFQYQDDWDAMNYVFEKDEAIYHITKINEKNLSDFIVEDNGNGTGTIVQYRGNEKILYLPEKVDNLKIIGIDRKTTRYKDNYERIEKIIVPDGYEKVGGFSNLPNLESIELPNSLTTIQKQAFLCCKKLYKVDIEDNVTSIFDEAFAECPALTEFTLPSKLERGCIERESGGIEGRVGRWLFRDSGIKKLFVRSQSVDPYETDCLEGCADYVIYAPKGSPFLTDEKYAKFSKEWDYQPSSISEIGTENVCDVVSDVHNSDEIVIDGPSYINQNTFIDFQRGSFSSVFVGRSVEKIYSNSFSGLKSLTSVKLSFGLEVIEQKAFSDCSNLTQIKIPDSVSSIGGWAFSNCTSLSEILLSQSLKRINKYTFYNCTSLKNIKTPNSVTILDDFSFNNCVNLEEVQLSQGLTRIGAFAFKDCHNLKSIAIPPKVSTIGESAFEDCEKLKEIVFGEKIKTIEKHAFMGCCGLQQISFPVGLKNIGWGAFSECSSLTSVVIPENVQSVEKYAFKDCSNLNSVTFLGASTQIGDNAFYKTMNITIHAPAGSYAESYARENNIPFVAE